MPPCGGFIAVEGGSVGRIDPAIWSELVGDAPCCDPNEAVAVGEAECEDGVKAGRLLGETADG